MNKIIHFPVVQLKTLSIDGKRGRMVHKYVLLIAYFDESVAHGAFYSMVAAISAA